VALLRKQGLGFLVLGTAGGDHPLIAVGTPDELIALAHIKPNAQSHRNNGPATGELRLGFHGNQ